jgi:hypothetical protein
MTVAHLIARLRELPQDLKVVRADQDTGVDREVRDALLGKEVTPYGIDDTQRVVRIR